MKPSVGLEIKCGQEEELSSHHNKEGPTNNTKFHIVPTGGGGARACGYPDADEQKSGCTWVAEAEATTFKVIERKTTIEVGELESKSEENVNERPPHESRWSQAKDPNAHHMCNPNLAVDSRIGL